jgi:ATPase subunit of ABC transporter with duplicated ATPase domains
MTSHDRAFMNRIVTKTMEIDGGTLTTYSGDYEFYEQQRALNEKQQQAQFERQQAMLAKEIKFIERLRREPLTPPRCKAGSRSWRRSTGWSLPSVGKR